MIYEELVAFDILQPIIPVIYEGRLELRDDGSIWMKKSPDPAAPWAYKGVCLDRDCAKWLELYFRYYRFIPKTCLSCWKIILLPSNIKEMFEGWKIMQKGELPARAGISALGYELQFYCPISGGLEVARRYERRLREKVKAAGIKGSFFLRRGCIDMEIAAGPSDKWTTTPEGDRLEYMLNQVFTQPPDHVEAPAYCTIHAQRLWIEAAWKKGDEFVKEFASSLPLPNTTFEGSTHSPKDFPVYEAPWQRPDSKLVLGGEDNDELR